MSNNRNRRNNTTRADQPQQAQRPQLGPTEAQQRRALELARTESAWFDLDNALHLPQHQPARVWSLEEVRQMFTLPLTQGMPADARENFNMAFDGIGGFHALHSNLNAHTSAIGQMPVTSFMGYGALQIISQNGMIRAAIQTVADDITKKWIEVTGGEEEDKERVAKLNDLLRRYNLQRVFHDAIASVGYFGGAFIFIDTGVKGDDLTLPLAIRDGSAEISKDKPLSFRVVDPCNVTPMFYNCTNPLAADYMKPRMWYVLGQKVHASRMLTLFDNEPPALLKPAYNFLGIPRAQILWDYVAHWNEARTYTNNLLSKVSLLVVKTDTDAIFSTPDGVRMFDTKVAALQRYRDCNSIYVCDKEREDVVNVQTSIAGATDIVRQCLENIAAINRTPAVKMLGISPSGFNATGESDIKNYYDHIRSQQELYRRHIQRCLNAIQLRHFGYIDNTIGFDFVELSADNDASRAMTASTLMQTLTTAVQTQVISAQEARDYVRKDPLFGLEFLTADAPDEEPQDMDGLDEMEGQPQMQEQQPTEQQPLSDLDRHPQEKMEQQRVDPDA